MKLEVINLTKKYDKKEVLKEIDFTFEEGKIYGLIGRNGAGKTTFFNALNGDISIDNGFFNLINEYGTNKLDTKDNFEKILIVAGRKSNTDELKPENAGLNLDNRKFVSTQNYSTNVDNIFAIGDITAKGFLAYTAEQDAINVAENLQSKNPVPKVVFSFPNGRKHVMVFFILVKKCNYVRKYKYYLLNFATFVQVFL